MPACIGRSHWASGARPWTLLLSLDTHNNTDPAADPFLLAPRRVYSKASLLYTAGRRGRSRTIAPSHAETARCRLLARCQCGAVALKFAEPYSMVKRRTLGIGLRCARHANALFPHCHSDSCLRSSREERAISVHGPHRAERASFFIPVSGCAYQFDICPLCHV